MNSIGVPPKPVLPSVAPTVSPDPQQTRPQTDQRVGPVLKQSETDTFAQRQAPPRQPTIAGQKPPKDHVAPPSALQLKISSILQKQAEARIEEAQKKVERDDRAEAEEKVRERTEKSDQLQRADERKASKSRQDEAAHDRQDRDPIEKPYEREEVIAAVRDRPENPEPAAPPAEKR